MKKLYIFSTFLILMLSLTACSTKEISSTNESDNVTENTVTEGTIPNITNPTKTTILDIENQLQETIPINEEPLKIPEKEKTKKSLEFMQKFLDENYKNVDHKITEYDDFLIEENPEFALSPQIVYYKVLMNNNSETFVHNVSNNDVLTTYGKQKLNDKMNEYLLNMYKDEGYKSIEAYAEVFQRRGLYFFEDEEIEDVISRTGDYGNDDKDYSLVVSVTYENSDSDMFFPDNLNFDDFANSNSNVCLMIKNINEFKDENIKENSYIADSIVYMSNFDGYVTVFGYHKVPLIVDDITFMHDDTYYDLKISPIDLDTVKNIEEYKEQVTSDYEPVKAYSVEMIRNELDGEVAVNSILNEFEKNGHHYTTNSYNTSCFTCASNMKDKIFVTNNKDVIRDSNFEIDGLNTNLLVEFVKK